MSLLWLNIVVGVILLTATSYVVATTPPQTIVDTGLLPVIAAALLYILSQCLRGIRLMILAIPTLEVSGRTTFALQFYTAAVAAVIPFKLGEIFRIQQLASISQRPVAAIVSILQGPKSVQRSLI